ncbi:hypothetical protein [Aestuariispira insulae]|uniref:Uncharacterized protein n=1 Tax=Aestuariispira insulae TaxID=1461337 RepID=A0A3D9HXB1_9PROT|nr:hypothetical protein [Aestuariispira insulae]RED53536.1 hypothetical protein DFP90_101327 [Aestuariispira insulae]
MDHGHHSYSADSAMTEIALALAMGFFSIMVLTMVSMGAGSGQEKAAAQAVMSVELAPAKPDASENSGKAEPAAEDIIVIYHEGSFFDADLKDLDPMDLPPDGRVILAMPPSLPMVEALEIRSRFNRDNLIVSTLDARWMEALGRK